MKKFYPILTVLGLISMLSCEKEITTNEHASKAPTTFEVTSPQTKTTLSGLHMFWATGDQIRVYGHNSDNDTYTDNGTYTITNGMGTGSAVFTKDDPLKLIGNYDAFYAVYPATKTLTFSMKESNTVLVMQVSKNEKTQSAVENGFETASAIMTAVFDGTRLAFRHGVGYIKFVLSEDGVSKVTLNLGDNCLVQTPTYKASDGSYYSGSSGFNTITISGSFVKGSAYYVPVVPRSDDSSKHINNLTINCTGGSTFTTDHFNGKDVEVGKVFNIGTLAKSTSVPILSADPVSIGASATVGSIAFNVDNPVSGQVLTATTTADWLTLTSNPISSSPIAFTCSTNNTKNSRTATVTLTCTYEGTGSPRSIDISVTQRGISISHDAITNVAAAGSTDSYSVTFTDAEGWTPSVTTDGTVVTSATLNNDATIDESPADRTITYTVAKNTDETAKSGTITVTLTKNELTLSEVIDVSQLPYTTASTIDNTYWFYADSNNSNDFINTSNKFTFSYNGNTTTSANASFSSGDTGNYNASSFTVEGITCTKGAKCDSKGQLTFTTSSSATNVQLVFYFACRKTGDYSAASMQVINNSDNSAQECGYNNPFGQASSASLTLNAGKSYTIKQKSKEQAIILVKLVETVPAG